MLGGILLTQGNLAPAGNAEDGLYGSTATRRQGERPSLRSNKVSSLTRAQVRERIGPQLEKGLTETQLQKLLGTLPVLTSNGELLWLLHDGFILTASRDGGEHSEIVCWSIRTF